MDRQGRVRSWRCVWDDRVGEAEVLGDSSSDPAVLGDKAVCSAMSVLGRRASRSLRLHEQFLPLLAVDRDD